MGGEGRDGIWCDEFLFAVLCILIGWLGFADYKRL